MYPNISWEEYFNGLLNPQVQVEATESVIVESPSYLESFSNIITKTPKRVLANYVVWRVLKDSTDSLYWVRAV